MSQKWQNKAQIHTSESKVHAFSHSAVMSLITLPTPNLIVIYSRGV